jgi:precorrin-6x reductase
MIESRIYCFKQRFFFARLVQKSHRTGRERSRPRVVVCVRRDENDRDARIRRPQLTLKIQSTHAWHPHIKKQAIRIVEFIRIQELRGRRETVRAHPNGAQQVVKRVPEKIVIVYN